MHRMILVLWIEPRIATNYYVQVFTSASLLSFSKFFGLTKIGIHGARENMGMKDEKKGDIGMSK